MRLRRSISTGVAALCLAGCAGAPLAVSPAPAPASAAAPKARAALDRAKHLADWQLSHMDDFSYVASFRDHTADPTGWIQSTFYIGLTALADASGDARFADAVVAHGDRQAWGFGDRPRHADDDAIGQAWLWAARHGPPEQRDRRLAPARARLEAVLAAPSAADMRFGEARGEQACQVRWCWSDALFMAPPLWAEMSVLTQDPRYLDHMDREFRAAVDTLYDPRAGLFFRDSRFIDRRGPQGAQIFWSRGNGWAYAGLARVLEVLPADHPVRPYYLGLYQQMTRAILATQGDDGFWPVSLMEPGGPPETSGTGFFVYGLAWGVNAGLVAPSQARPAIDKGWRALVGSIGPDGRLGWVQQVGYAPDRVTAEDTQLYGVGAFLLAAAEISRLQGGQP